MKPINSIIADRNYCYICRIGVTYNEEKIRNMKKMLLIHNNFLEIKKDIQLCTDFHPTWMHHYKTSYVTGLGNCKWHYLQSFIDEYIYALCFNDK